MKRNAFAVIDTGHLRNNLRLIQRTVGSARIMAVVKADAYGHGLIECAKALESADALAVACINEALTLRQNNIHLPIICLQGFANSDELHACIQHHITPVIHHSHQIQLLHSLHTSTSIDVWLKVDTGMGRLGFFPSELSQIYSELDRLSCIRRIKLMSHFANADHSDISLIEKPLQQFIDLCRHFPRTEYSCANSAAIFASQLSHMDWVRPGLALYGVSPFDPKRNVLSTTDLQPVMSVCAPVISIKRFPVGAKIGYGSTYTCNRESRIAIAAIGYSEGYPRTIDYSVPVYINGLYASVVGRVSMDMIAIDITEISCSTGDLVEAWGNHISVNMLAYSAETIPYELLCNATGSIAKQYL